MQTLCGMLYAGDEGVVSPSLLSLKNMMVGIVKVCAAFGLTVLEPKTEAMCLQPRWNSVSLRPGWCIQPEAQFQRLRRGHYYRPQ